MNRAPSVSLDAVKQRLAQLPPLPSSVRYFDDLFEMYRSVRDLDTRDVWDLVDDGETVPLRFDQYAPHLRHLMKHVAVDMLMSSLGTGTTLGSLGRASLGDRSSVDQILENMVGMPPNEFREFWNSTIARITTPDAAGSLLRVLRSLCRLAVGNWSKDYLDYIKRLQRPSRDIYRVVRTGECFVPLDQQSLVHDYFDELSAACTSFSERLGDNELRDACLLLIVYQHAFRPSQVARVRLADIRVHNTGAVHFATMLLKKRDKKERIRVTRRIKREWCPIFIEYRSRRIAGMLVPKDVPGDSFFGLTPRGVGDRVQSLMERFTSDDWSATDLRHTAAQRLADAGVSHIALSEFMGHSSIRTANVYFDTSPTQAQRVNQALAISPVYSAVAEIARTKTINKATLLHLPPDQQIGGVPHGIPIAGIGACGMGQSLCSKNPVLSCYTCSRFMPLRDAHVHRRVAEELKPVVLDFADASRGNEVSPAFTQLRRMLTAAERVAADIEASHE